MSKTEMLINYVPGEECRIAIVEDGRLEELYQERASAESHVGNIYKGKVTNVEPSIQAAFIDFGLERNGFLHISDLHPMYFPGDAREEFERVGSKTPRRERPPIQKCLRRGQDVLVQVIKEGIGTKGPTLTSYISIPGRFIVMMPHMERLGVSRKIEDDDSRRNMRNMLAELDPPPGFGFIIRTAGMDRTKAELKRDLAYLQRLWKSIEARMKKVRVGELYTESDLVIRTIRDVLSADLQRIVVDDPGAAKRAHEFLTIASPRSTSNVVLYKDPVPLFHRYGIEPQIETISARQVPLPSGGSLVIDSTEALVAVDVNSGKSRDARDAETNAYRTNLEAADEICRQLRLRDLGGVIVLDLIDMMVAKHRRAVEQRFRQNLKKDRARTRIASISTFGLLEMTRQRMRPSLKKSIYVDCVHCRGAGQIKSNESVVLDVMRRLALVMHRRQVARVDLIVSPGVAFQLLNNRRAALVALEQQHNKRVMVRVQDSGPSDEIQVKAYDSRDSLIDTDALGPFEEPLFETVEAMAEIDEEPYATAAARAPHSDLEIVEEATEAAAGEATAAASEHPSETREDDNGEGEEKPRRRRRRRRGGRGRRKHAAETTETSADTTTAADTDATVDDSDTTEASDSDGATAEPIEETVAAESIDTIDDHATVEAEAAQTTDSVQDEEASTADTTDAASSDEPAAEGEAAPKRRRRRRGGRGRGRSKTAATAAAEGETSTEASAEPTSESDVSPEPQPDPSDNGTIKVASRQPATPRSSDAKTNTASQAKSEPRSTSRNSTRSGGKSNRAAAAPSPSRGYANRLTGIAESASKPAEKSADHTTEPANDATAGNDQA